jgi:hypothetical protein
MGRVTFDMTVSLDGFVTGPNDNPDNGLGDGGERSAIIRSSEYRTHRARKHTGDPGT